MNQLRCRDLKPGDILLKMATTNLTSQAVQSAQKLAGQANTSIVHAALALDTQFCIEAQNRGYGYLVHRPVNTALGQGAATAAKLLFDIHQRHGNLSYGLGGAVKSVLGKPGAAKSAESMEALLDRILAGKGQPFFCSQLVVYVYQWAAEQSGIPGGTVLNVSDAKASPSVLASRLVANPNFNEAGYLMPNER
jgi:hypothetical protein